jgi:hypothetical protein
LHSCDRGLWGNNINYKCRHLYCTENGRFHKIQVYRDRYWRGKYMASRRVKLVYYGYLMHHKRGPLLFTHYLQLG